MRPEKVDSRYLVIQTVNINFKRETMPRPYKLGQRQVATDRTRASILAAARELLAGEGGVAGFTMDAVASQANVSRMTVYYQFQSKSGLLEALCDDLADKGGMEQLAKAFSRADPLKALDELVKVFARFWGSDRRVVRRLHAMAALDPEIEAVIRAREERRREGLRVLVHRMAEQYGRPAPKAIEDTVNVLWALISFEMFHALAGTDREFGKVAPQVVKMARAAIGFG
jgi:AcrR family transcriptional regulator